LQVEFGRLREKIKNERGFLEDIERVYTLLSGG
jgi:hypothetical protein